MRVSRATFTPRLCASFSWAAPAKLAPRWRKNCCGGIGGRRRGERGRGRRRERRREGQERGRERSRERSREGFRERGERAGERGKERVRGNEHVRRRIVRDREHRPSSEEVTHAHTHTHTHTHTARSLAQYLLQRLESLVSVESIEGGASPYLKHSVLRGPPGGATFVPGTKTSKTKWKKVK